MEWTPLGSDIWWKYVKFYFCTYCPMMHVNFDFSFCMISQKSFKHYMCVTQCAYMHSSFTFIFLSTAATPFVIGTSNFMRRIICMPCCYLKWGAIFVNINELGSYGPIAYAKSTIDRLAYTEIRSI